MTADSDVRDLLHGLTSDDPRERAVTLEVISRNPTGSAEVLAGVRELLADRTAAPIGIPRTYGEIRWLAAHAVAAEQEKQAVQQAVVVADTPAPLGVTEIYQAAQAAQIRFEGGDDGLSRTFAALRDGGFLETTTLRW